MHEKEWHVVEEIDNEISAEMMRGFLNAQGIQAELVGGGTMPFTSGPMVRIQIVVRADDLPRAKQLVADYYAGEYEDMQLEGDDDKPDHEDEPDGEDK